MHLRLVILLISFFYYSALPGQDITTVFSSLGVNDGLPSSSVYGLYQDSKGLVWAAGPEGLSRYDANSVNNYSPADANAAFSPFFREAPLEGPGENLWMTSESGICKFDRDSKKFKTLVRLPGISRQYFLDKEGWLWLHHIDRGIMRYHTSSGRLNIFPHPFQADAVDWNSFCSTTDEKERIWFYTSNNQVFYEFNIRAGIYRSLPGTPVNNLIYAAGQLYLGTSEGLAVFDVQNNKVLYTVKLPGEKNCRLKDVVIDRVGRTWAGFLGQGIISVDRNGKLLAWHRQDNHNINTLSSDLVTTLMIDRNQNLWIGTDGGGISKLNLKTVPFSKFPVSTQSYPALSSFFVRGICEDSDGNILFGAFNSGLCRLDITTGALHIYKNAPGNLKEINNITDIGGGRFLIGARTGLFLFHQAAETFTALSIIPPAKTPAPYDHGVTDILQTGENEFVLATTRGPALLKASGNEWYVTSTAEKRLLRKINQVHPAGNGIFYMTVANGGLWRVQLVNSEFIIVDTFLAHHAIRCIHSDEEKPNVLWLSTNKGVVRFDDSSHTSTAITTGNGLLSNNTYGILEDELHRLWISSNGGLACYSKGDGHIRNYTFRNGLQSNEFNSGASYKSRKGVLFFGGVKGMNWFTAATVGSDTIHPFTEITSIVADETEVLPDNNHYTIPGYKNSFTITAAVLDYTHPGANLVRYKMEGWDNDWITAPTGTIRYTNMRPGAYTFRLVGIAGNALESAEKDIFITINAPVWDRRWFHFLVMALLVLIPATLLYQRRISRSKREMEKQRLLAMERTRISQDLHDEIGGAITRIGLVSSLIPQKNKMHQDIDKEVDMIASTARQVAASMGEIVWALHTDYNTLESLLAYIREQATVLIGPSGIRLEVNFPDVVPDMQLSGEARRNLLLVTKEALNNAVKHARPTHITLGCAISKTTITFTVQDDGVGFDPATPGTGNGIRNMHKRMQSVGGTIEWHKLPRGTEVAYSVTIGN